MKAISLSEMSRSQRDKWISGIDCQQEGNLKIQLKPISEKVLIELNQRIKQRYESRNFFDIEDIKGTAIPTRNGIFKIHVDKHGFPKVENLFDAWVISMVDAPALAWSHILNMADLGCLPKGIDPENSDVFLDFCSRMRERSSEFSLGEQFNPDDHIGHQVLGLQDPVGEISLLQQGAGKLRTVCNPKRLVQWTSIPLGEALQDMFYHRPGVYVLDQHAGMRAIQGWLKEGKNEVYSFDLSSATDTLDYKRFLRDRLGFENPEFGDKYPFLNESLENFVALSSSSWKISEEAQKKLGIRSETVSFNFGQPLGLRPSFPTLSLMNYTFGMIAQQLAERDQGYRFSECQFAVVGDDFACTEPLAKYYTKLVTAYNGRTNLEKTMHSKTHAEFCSHLITSSKIIAMKPRYELEESQIVNNLDKFQGQALSLKAPKVIKEMWQTSSAYHISDIEYYHSAHVDRKGFIERCVAHLANGLSPDTRQKEVISKETLLSRSQVASQVAKVTSDIMYRIDGFSNKLQDLSFLQRPVEVGAYEVWDWKTNRYEIPRGDTRALLRKRFNDVSRISKESDNSLFYLQFNPYKEKIQEAFTIVEPCLSGMLVHTAIGERSTHTEYVDIRDILKDKADQQAYYDAAALARALTFGGDSLDSIVRMDRAICKSKLSQFDWADEGKRSQLLLKFLESREPSLTRKTLSSVEEIGGDDSDNEPSVDISKTSYRSHDSGFDR
jgi:hypothetical protein